MNKISYIFTRGRLKKINNLNYSDDFFYGARFINKISKNLEIIEFKSKNRFFTKLEHYLSRLFSLPLYVFSIISSKNKIIFRKSNKIILVSESAAFAALPYLIRYKKSQNIKVYLFVMGLFSKKIRYKKFLKIHKYLIKLLSFYVDTMFFLGSEELNEAKKSELSTVNLTFLPFHIDQKFWTNENLNISSNKNIVFVGNDGNRDFQMVIRIAKKLPDKNFVIVSSNFLFENVKLHNLQIIKGDWATSKISDFDLKEIYKTAKIVILPMKESSQPSGQSVTLQSMSLGIPVLITKTKGFWDPEKFNDGENIIYLKQHTLEEWAKEINLIWNDNSKLEKISKNGINLVNRNYSIDKFNELLYSELLEEN